MGQSAIPYATLEQNYRETCRRVVNMLTLIRECVKDNKFNDARATVKHTAAIIKEAMLDENKPIDTPLQLWQLYEEKVRALGYAMVTVNLMLDTDDVKESLDAIKTARKIADYRYQRPAWGHFGGIARVYIKKEMPYKTRQTIVYVDGKISQGGATTMPRKKLNIDFSQAFMQNLEDMKRSSEG
jgi:flagellin-specific chaperone FliS